MRPAGVPPQRSSDLLQSKENLSLARIADDALNHFLSNLAMFVPAFRRSAAQWRSDAEDKGGNVGRSHATTSFLASFLLFYYFPLLQRLIYRRVY
jgi:hypothetical protein